MKKIQSEKVIVFKYDILVKCLVSFLIIFGASLEKVKIINIQYFIEPNFYEVVLEFLNSINTILFSLSIIMIIFSITRNGNNSLEQKNKSTWYLKQAVISAFLIVAIIITANIIISIARSGFNGIFTNTWTHRSEFSELPMKPFVSLLISILLFGLRSVFCIYLLHLINEVTKKPYWGFWSILFIIFIDFRFYKQTHIDPTLNILPIEHTRIAYTIGFNLLSDGTSRGSYLVSVLYWIVLILLINIIFNITVRKGKEG